MLAAFASKVIPFNKIINTCVDYILVSNTGWRRRFILGSRYAALALKAKGPAALSAIRTVS
jgi:hypothetical protein